jgi:hypothetical protein
MQKSTYVYIVTVPLSGDIYHPGIYFVFLQAVDLCLETEQLDLLLQDGMVDEASVARVCLYLFKCAGKSTRH